MSNYNTFIVQDCRSGKVMLVTSSARKATRLFEKGKRIEVWNGNSRVERITVKTRERNPMEPYIEAEKEYIRKKQERHTKKAVSKWQDPAKKSIRTSLNHCV